MKKETETLLGYVASCIKNDKAYKQFQDFIKQVKESEKVLTTGGYVQDSNGTPVKAGDFICFINRFGDERNHGVAYMQVIYWAGRLSIGEPQNDIAKAASVHLFDIQDLVENDVKFFKVEDDFDEEPIWATVKGERRLLKPVVMKKDDGETYLEMNDDESNFYKMDEVDWTGSSFS
jgi:hypothetical protein